MCKPSVPRYKGETQRKEEEGRRAGPRKEEGLSVVLKERRKSERWGPCLKGGGAAACWEAYLVFFRVH